MAKYTGFRYGGCPVWLLGNTYYKLISKHKTKNIAEATDKRWDKCDKIVKIGKWYGRFNKLPLQQQREIKKR